MQLQQIVNKLKTYQEHKRKHESYVNDRKMANTELKELIEELGDSNYES